MKMTNAARKRAIAEIKAYSQRRNELEESIIYVPQPWGDEVILLIIGHEDRWEDVSDERLLKAIEIIAKETQETI